jgi:eukaryotic-like serine/threonine-protein kinase
LLEEIGQGGMGTVWAAEQTTVVRRKVALKLIKAGMDSRSVWARFEAQRQALALMDHPNIAKVLDGGLTKSGRASITLVSVDQVSRGCRYPPTWLA